MAQSLPHLARILLYPIKSMQPIEVDACRLLRSGALESDRLLAIFDADGRVINGKRTPVVHTLQMSFDPTLRTVTVTGAASRRQSRFHLDRERSALHEWLGEQLGLPVVIKENTSAGWPDDTDSPGPTVISTATLREVASWFGISPEQARLRFRANLEIDGVEPFWEDRLYGPAGSICCFRIGEVNFEGVNPCQRCAVPPRDPATGTNIPGFAATFMAKRKETLPMWADRSRFNHFYRLAVNTRLADGEHGKTLCAGDEIQIG